MRSASTWAALTLLLIAATSATSCGNSDYRMFSLNEGIGHFSMEYPAEYTVTRIDIRNDSASKYTDIGLGTRPVAGSPGLNEISIYAWPAESSETAVLVLDGLLARASSIFQDFRLLDRFAVMIGDMEGQGATFSWTASVSVNASEANTLAAVSRMVCFRHGDLAWEVHVASGEAVKEQAETEFQRILDTFRILD